VYGSPHPENMGAVCTGVKVDQDTQNPYLWDAAATWQVNPPSKRDPADQQKQPDQRREKWSMRFVPIPFAPYVDLAGNLLASSAGQPFDPVIEQPIICDEITVQRYEPECHRISQQAFMDKTNSAVWCGAASGTALMQNIVVGDEYIQGAYWFLHTYTILYKPRYFMTLPHETEVMIGGWDPEYIPDVGTLQWATVDGQTKLVPITRTDPITKKLFYDGRPAFLDGAGHELPRNAAGVYTADPVFREFHLKERVNFSILGLNPPPGLTFD
jgi:hypothetical protein